MPDPACQRKLISINKVYTGHADREINLRWDWNSLLDDEDAPRLGDYTEEYFPGADDLVRYLEDYARRHGLNIETGVDVKRVSRDGDGFVVEDARGGSYRARRLVVATGCSLPHVPQIPGSQHAELYDHVSVDPADFRNQRVLILGKGNSGFETADNLVGAASAIHVASPRPLRMAWESKYVGHVRAVNNNLIDTYQLKSQNAILDATCERIEHRDGRLHATFLYAHADGERETLAYDRIICCTGFRFDTSVFDESCRPDLVIDGRFPGQTSAFESTNVPGLFFAGSLMQARDWKKKQSGFIHGFRYNLRALHRIFELRYFGNEWPHRRVAPEPGALSEAVLARVNRSSALWQQTGFLCDLIVVPRDGSPARYYEELPTAYVHDSPFDRYADYYTVTLDSATRSSRVARTRSRSNACTRTTWSERIAAPRFTRSSAVTPAALS